ncbi:MAG: DUF3224 domain-containing protein [Holophagaceae bacterium]
MIPAAALLVLAAQAPAPASLQPAPARGTFEVKIEPAKETGFADASLGRLLLHKTYHGDLEAAAEGQMLSAGAPATGNAGYVALERVTGVLAGRRGSFALLHRGTITAGQMELAIEVVPGSGTDGLAGLAGRMTIEIKDGRHRYAFTYTLPAKP